MTSSVWRTLTDARATQSQIIDAASKDNDWWNSFGNEELVKQYGSAEDAYKYYQRDDSYRKKYTGLTSEELYGLVGDLDDGEEKDWLNSYASSVDYDEKGKLDITKATTELDDLGNLYDQAYTIGLWYDEYKRGYAPYDAQKLEAYNRFMNEFGGDVNALKGAISEKKVQIKQAKDIQESNRLAEEWGSYTKAADFEKYAALGAAVENPTFADAHGTWLGPWQFGGEDIGNIVTFSRDNYSDIMTSSEGGRYNTVGNGLYNNMTEDEVKLHNYLLGKEKDLGKEYEGLASSYLSYLEPTLKEREGKKTASQIQSIDIPVLEDLAVITSGLAGGIEQWAKNTGSFFTGEEADPSILQHTNAYLSDSLGGIGYYAHQAATTVGNMAPSILVSTVLGGAGLSASLAEGVGAATVGVSAAGGAYADALAKGYDKKDARTYSTLVGVSEATLQYLIGGIGALGGVSNKILFFVFLQSLD